MPELKQIEVSLELGTSNTKLKEYGARYSDGHVETFIAVPDTDMPFTLHITTKHYIAPGISFFVFMDGEYQCNRNKLGLKLPGDGIKPHEYETEFRLRQKEEKTSAGSFVAREWRFARLNTVAADKAPSLNPDFLRNVGTIEIVAMRCRPAAEEVSQNEASTYARVDAKTSQRAPSKVSKAKESTQVPAKAPSKAPPGGGGDMFGGMFGLFDGAGDSMGLDGANDERPIFQDGRVEPQPTPGFAWDAHRGQFQPITPYPADMPGGAPGPATVVHTSGLARAKAFMAEVEQGPQNADLDGQNGWQREYPNERFSRPQDDLRGDRYLGMTGRDRTHYKQHFRERGDQVSQTARPPTGTTGGFVCNTKAAEEEIQKAPIQLRGISRVYMAAQDKGYYESTPDGLRLFAADLEVARQDLVQHNRKHPGSDTDDAWRDLRRMKAKLDSMRSVGPPGQLRHGQPHYGVAATTTAQEEAEEDFCTLRVELRIASQQYLNLDYNAWLGWLEQTEKPFRISSLWLNQRYADEAESLNARRMQLWERNQVISTMLNGIRQIDSAYSNQKLESRLQKIHEEGMEIDEKLKRMWFGPTVPTTPNINATGNNVGCQQGYDGAPTQQSANSTTPKGSFWGNGAATSDWKQVGAGFQQPGDKWGTPKLQSTHEHFGGEKLQNANDCRGGEQKAASGWGGAAADTWGQTQQDGNPAKGSQVGSKREGQNGWGTGSQQQQDGNGRDAQPQKMNASRPVSNAGGGDGWDTAGSNKGGEGDRGNQSQRESQKGGGGDDAVADQGDQGAGWGAQCNKSQSKSGGWGNNAHQSKSNGSNAGGRSVARDAIAPKPDDLIKPYWKAWNQPVSVNSRSASPARPREVAREVYTYPAERLPAIPEGKATGASHGVQTGRGAEYNHLCRRPIYIDTMEQPYAVFSFKYRSKERLKQITGLDVKSIDEDVKAVQKQAQRDKLMQTPKEQLIEQLMTSSASKSGSRTAASVSGGGQGWGDKPASNGVGGQGWADKPMSNSVGWIHKSKTKSAVGSGWGKNDNGQANGGGGGGRDNNGNDQANGGWGGSTHSKSKRRASNGWGAGAGGWDGQQDAQQQNGAANIQDDTQSRPDTLGSAPPMPVAYKWDDAFRAPGLEAAAAAVNALPGTGWGERDTASSIFEDGYGMRWKGSKEIGWAPGKGPHAGNTQAAETKKEGDGLGQGGGWNEGAVHDNRNW